jgi:hypothetical protein
MQILLVEFRGSGRRERYFHEVFAEKHVTTEHFANLPQATLTHARPIELGRHSARARGCARWRIARARRAPCVPSCFSEVYTGDMGTLSAGRPAQSDLLREPRGGKDVAAELIRDAAFEPLDASALRSSAALRAANGNTFGRSQPSAAARWRRSIPAVRVRWPHVVQTQRPA